jgi:hypothetical protein
MTTPTANAFPLVRVNESTIERAGTCLDGDNCPRYHCRLCGQYWLGNERHTCGLSRSGLEAPSHVKQLERKICTWMAEALEQNRDFATCTRIVLEKVKAAGLGEALLDAYGDRLIRELWRDRDLDDDEVFAPAKVNGAAAKVAPVIQPRPVVRQAMGVAWTALRYQVLNEGSSPPDRAGPAEGDEDMQSITPDNLSPLSGTDSASPLRPVADTPDTWAPPGTRRVDVEQLASAAALLESLFEVDGNWIRLGDLDRRRCRVLQLEYEAVADDARARAVAFGRLTAGLVDGQTVRERWTPEQLEDLVGDTLGAAPARPKIT